MFSTFLDFFTGIKIESAQNHKTKQFWFWLSVSINLGFLGVFKYYDFFVTSFAEAIAYAGIYLHPTTLNIILPVGISFYTFHGLSYIIDIQKNRIKAERDFINYGLFVSFFPLLVAGPIERATHLLPQIKSERKFDYSKSVKGLRQILWGLFKKVVVADNCAIYVDAVFPNYHGASTSQLVLSVFLFAFQIYGDFSGYSDMALGIAKLFGIDLLRNFSYPYFSRDIAEFWRRWHISLSSWFRDYVYIPLGGSKGSVWKKVKNTFIIFLISGFWHGANWTFIIWGILNAIYFTPLLLSQNNRNHLNIVAENNLLPSLKELMQICFTFLLTCIAWIFFRAPSIHIAIDFIHQIISNPTKAKIDQLSATYSLISIFILIIMEWLGRHSDIPFSNIKQNKLRRLTYIIIVLLIFFMGAFVNPRSFIYFQF